MAAYGIVSSLPGYNVKNVQNRYDKQRMSTWFWKHSCSRLKTNTGIRGCVNRRDVGFGIPTIVHESVQQARQGVNVAAIIPTRGSLDNLGLFCAPVCLTQGMQEKAVYLI
ncbi:hypothetical protein T310_5079 [Rasamsonia emersonii CBS 393.64]|uniref:Uncharacterized protein n=1 Tax=Rasamsonia emersonii (strain ATCC 16479 / CBS 393.64 / IMI 116815) TaxID=1408163 RepID=A0A0F4YS22_RASE3|nr:hypothetical protein T310_5079 [Rasamsonia emersonii CBS 393.64]KKA20890.1 hypothetical protein T310_5079 [Rasamsonia emersonii CBS 393.64]